MSMVTQYFKHRRACKAKQDERSRRIESLTAYHGPLTPEDRTTIDRPIEDIVRDVHSGALRPIDVLRTYGRVALRAHAKTNCLTEVMIADAEKWIGSDINFQGPLAGIPISLKDTIFVAGYDSTSGYSSCTGDPAAEDAPVIRLLKDAGAVPYVKTNIPITLLSFESTNDVWGRCTNPHNSRFSPGGSTGGEGALLALGGRIGIGSDVAGSVRAPAHFSGVYALKCSTGRWTRTGGRATQPGQDGVPAVYSPMARTLADLTYFTRALIQMEPSKYDHTSLPIAWRSEIEAEFAKKDRLRVGVMRTDGIVDPSPACARALSMAEEALRRAGHEIVEIDPPSPYEGVALAAILLNADGCRTYRQPFRPGEWNDPGTAQMQFLMDLPRPLKYLYYLWVRYVRRDRIWAGMVRDWHAKSVYENWQLVTKREMYKNRWFEWWNRAGMDVLITPPFPTPATPHDGMKGAFSACAYTFLFNLLDYTAGVMPVTRVDRAVDQLPAGFKLSKLNGVAQGVYQYYDADAMHGLPVAVQVVGRRLEEEKVLAVMQRIEDALGDDKYQLLEVD